VTGGTTEALPPTVDVTLLAGELLAAEAKRAPVTPLSTRYSGLDVATAYRVQAEVIRRRLRSGDRVCGHKIGLTSAAMQQLLGVDEPDYGVILDSMCHPNGSTVELAQLIAPKVEAEIAFVIERPLRGPGVGAAEVLAATRHVVPSLEIIDSRVADWRITLVDTVADNASSARVVVGDSPLAPDALELGAVAVSLLRNGEQVSAGMGAAVLGHPALAVAWLVNKLAEYGEGIGPGELVMPGAVSAPTAELRPGDEVSAVFAGMGTVSVRFR
jgi:2-keto-4-pentenoate hydratase